MREVITMSFIALGALDVGGAVRTVLPGAATMPVDTAADTILNAAQAAAMTTIVDDVNSYPKCPSSNIWGLDSSHPFAGKAYAKAMEAMGRWSGITTGSHPGDILGGEMDGAIFATGVIPGTAKKYHTIRRGALVKQDLDAFVAIENLSSTVVLQISNATKIASLNETRKQIQNSILRLDAWIAGMSAEIANREKKAAADINTYNAIILEAQQAEKDRLAREQADRDQADRDRLAREQADLEEHNRIVDEKNQADAYQQGIAPVEIQPTEKSKTTMYLLAGGAALAAIWFLTKK